MPTTICFSYPGNVPPGRRGGTNTACFSYQSDVATDVAVQPSPSGKTSTTCFRY